MLRRCAPCVLLREMHNWEENDQTSWKGAYQALFLRRSLCLVPLCSSRKATISPRPIRSVTRPAAMQQNAAPSARIRQGMLIFSTSQPSRPTARKKQPMREVMLASMISSGVPIISSAGPYTKKNGMIKAMMPSRMAVKPTLLGLASAMLPAA